MLEHVAFNQKLKKGKAVGKPVFSGFTFEYSGPMNAATAGASTSYQVYSKTVKKKTVISLKPVKFTVNYTPASDSVTLNVSSSKPFAKGGEIMISGVTNQAGVALSSSDTTLTISPNAKGITVS